METIADRERRVAESLNLRSNTGIECPDCGQELMATDMLLMCNPPKTVCVCENGHRHDVRLS